MPTDAPAIEVEVIGDFTDEHIAILAELLVDLSEDERA
jgi:hypothetical protein